PHGRQECLPHRSKADVIAYNEFPMSQPENSASSKSWQARIGEATDALAASFVESLSYDRRLYKHDIAGSIAHATMLQKVGLISAKVLKAIVRGLKEIEKEIEKAGANYGESWPGWKVELEDVHMCIEAALIEKIGD